MVALNVQNFLLPQPRQLLAAVMRSFIFYCPLPVKIRDKYWYICFCINVREFDIKPSPFNSKCPQKTKPVFIKWRKSNAIHNFKFSWHIVKIIECRAIRCIQVETYSF